MEKNKTALSWLKNVINIKMVDKERNVEELFALYKNASPSKQINVGRFFSALEKTGIRRTDPRLKELMEELEELKTEIGEEGSPPESINLDFDLFQRFIDKNLVLVCQALSQKLVIPDFEDFGSHLTEIYRNCRNNQKVQIQ